MQDETDSQSSNLPEFTVGEIGQALKRTVEQAFERVRVRGEISRPTRAGSGHIYMTLKDENAVLDAVCWKGTAGRLSVQPEEGMEVIAVGKLTTYPGRSKYQMVVEQLELAGEGALLKLLEDRRRRLAAEGLFDQDRKKPIPFLPSVIGVVTSPTGAVIRDILHRISDRFPAHVLVWPVLVQGDGAKDQIARAIRGFDEIEAGGPIPRPDLVIVARGGGSLEDLWSFNEEEVVRAAAACSIPLISAVGHETDTTLIDFASDRRAPTPTAAAEMAVPVRAELAAQIEDDGARLATGVARRLSDCDVKLTGLARGLGDPMARIEQAQQRLDFASQNMVNALGARLDRFEARLQRRIPSPAERVERVQARFGEVAGRLRLAPIERAVADHQRELDRLTRNGARSLDRFLERRNEELSSLERVLEANSFERVLDRGFVLVRDGEGAPVLSSASTTDGMPVSLQFRDGAKTATIGEGESVKKPPKPRAKPVSPKQESLF